MSEFEKWWKKEINVKVFSLIKNNYPDGTFTYADHTTNLGWITWQAATAESAKRIAELKAKVSELDGMLGSRNLHKEHEYLQRMSELQDQNNVLREALKENEFPYSANLDIYNSVRFSDAPYGTMIMESKIVKWLCRNRAKDYFDKMVEGK